MYNQQPSPGAYARNSASASGYVAGRQVASQYGGIPQSGFQPTGYVQSMYGQNVSSRASYGAMQAGAFGASGSSFSNVRMSQPAGAQPYHSAQYVGNQPNHDQYKRSDAGSLVQNQFGSFAGRAFQNQAAQSFMKQAQPAGAQAYHTAQYAGNQPNHDQYKRSDAGTLVQNQFTPFAGSFQNQAAPSFSMQSQPAGPQAYHAAQYAGNQPNHDQYKRSDAGSLVQG